MNGLNDKISSAGTGNRLAAERSPYLLQHADNPVDWFPWGDEAFEKAKREDKPIFLSIGYSTCHWCHVMERESFEDPEVAALINTAFIPVKVDREERPDIDSLYMDAAHVLGQSGGWPLNIILTPDGKPFFAATYVPKERSVFSSGMLDLVPAIGKAWKNKRSQIEASGEDVLNALRNNDGASGGSSGNSLRFTDDSGLSFLTSSFERVFNFLSDQFDTEYGGFGKGTKFPQPHNLLFLIRFGKLTGNTESLRMAEETLKRMRRGGIYDHLGFGFHRYSTDREWLVPHFEKMLCDQSLLALTYTEAYQAAGNEEYRRTAEEILGYLVRDMHSPEKGFSSAEDADSEGAEGKYYLWTLDEFKKALRGREDAEKWADYFNLEKDGNYFDRVHQRKPGNNILYTEYPMAEDAEEVRRLLLEVRAGRPKPGLDDKILTDWNGLAIRAFARAGWVFNNPEYIRTAEETAGFIIHTMKRPDGSLHHRYRSGEAGIPGTLDDYAFLISGLLELYRGTFKPSYLKEAAGLAAYCDEHFLDRESGGYFMTASYQDDLPVREKEGADSAIPSGNSVHQENLLLLFKLTGSSIYRSRAEDLVRSFGNLIDQYPWGFPMMLTAAMLISAGGKEILLAGPDTEKFLSLVNSRYLPFSAVLKKTAETGGALAETSPFTAGYPADEGNSAAYVCSGFTCGLPLYTAADLLPRLD